MASKIKGLHFEWDNKKALLNLQKHGVSFQEGRLVFEDQLRLIECDMAHSGSEKRYYCYGIVKGRVLTVRFTYRGEVIRIIGAAYWRKGKEKYGKKNSV